MPREGFPTGDTWAIGPLLSLSPGSTPRPLPDLFSPAKAVSSHQSLGLLFRHLSLFVAQATGCRKSGLGQGWPGCGGELLLHLLWPDCTPPLNVAKMLLPPGEWTLGHPPSHLYPARQMEPPQSSEASVILSLCHGLGTHRAEAGPGCQSPSRHICYGLRDKEPTGDPAGGLCSLRLRSAACVPAHFYLAHLPGELE